MIGRLWKTGNSVVVTLDKKVQAAANLQPGDIVKITATAPGKITLEKAMFSIITNGEKEGGPGYETKK